MLQVLAALAIRLTASSKQPERTQSIPRSEKNDWGRDWGGGRRRRTKSFIKLQDVTQEEMPRITNSRHFAKIISYLFNDIKVYVKQT